MQDSGKMVQENNALIQSALSSKDYALMKQYADTESREIDTAIAEISAMPHSEKLQPAKAEWLLALQNFKTMTDHMSTAAGYYQEGNTLKGNYEMVQANEALDIAGVHLDRFNSMDFV